MTLSQATRIAKHLGDGYLDRRIIEAILDKLLADDAVD